MTASGNAGPGKGENNDPRKCNDSGPESDGGNNDGLGPPFAGGAGYRTPGKHFSGRYTDQRDDPILHSQTGRVICDPCFSGAMDALRDARLYETGAGGNTVIGRLATRA